MPLSLTRTPRGVLILALLLPIRGSVSPAFAQEPSAPGLHDLVVYDPGVHERGLPKAVFKPHGDYGFEIDIPPAVHVHRYYYSGDKEIQGPIINGGPTVVVANHPKTGNRMYIDVVLPSGAPRIAYNKHGITYVYPNQRVEVKFQSFPFDPNKAVIKNHHGKGWGRTVHDAHQHATQHVKEGLSSSPMVQSVKKATGDASDLLHGVKVSLGDLSTQGADGLKTLTNMVPGVTYLRSLAEERPNRQYQTQTDSATERIRRETPAFVPTIR